MSRMQPRNAKVPEPRSQQLRLDLLHTFESAARHLSFTKAGEELFLSQSAVSRQVQQLLRAPTRPLKSPADLERQTLLIVEMRDAPLTADWEPWLQLMGLPGLHMSHTVRFTQYAEAVAAAVAGQGVVIGRLPLLADLVRQKKLVAPFRSPAASRRGYYVTLAPHAAHNPSARAFADWLQAEAAEALPTSRRT